MSDTVRREFFVIQNRLVGLEGELCEIISVFDKCRPMDGWAETVEYADEYGVRYEVWPPTSMVENPSSPAPSWRGDDSE